MKDDTFFPQEVQSNPEKTDYLNLYLSYFQGREDYFACQGPEYYFPINLRLNEEYLSKHIEGLATFGIYVLTSTNMSHLFCLDVDIPKSELDSVDYQNAKVKFAYLKDKLLFLLDSLTDLLRIPRSSLLLEDTGGRGYHIWLFFSRPLEGNLALDFLQALKERAAFDFEFFPKQATLTPTRRFGNLIKLPLGIHQKYGLRSKFFIVSEEKPVYLNSFYDNMAHLASTTRIDSDKATKSIKKQCKHLTTFQPSTHPERLVQEERKLFEQDFEFLFNNCHALKKLKAKAEAGLKLSRVEAFNLANLLLSVKNGRNLLLELVKTSYGRSFNPSTTQSEIDSILPLHPSSCARLIQQHICPGYCSDDIRRRNEDALLPNTNPIALWLMPNKSEPCIAPKEILREISLPSNIINAYWKLKKYHRDEDVGFYDEFDFKYFEANLYTYSKYIARAFENEEEIPLIGHLGLRLPKKLDENNQMHYRPMVHSSVFDLVVAQSVFNVVGRIIEHEFHESSYGYRMEVNDPASESIFIDWREHYPRFRGKTLAWLRQSNIKYYICCDIQGFYDHVGHKLLFEQLKGVVPNGYVFHTVERIVRSYSFEEDGLHGLPQGPAYARILANLYLNDFDREISRSSTGYLRYVDDLFLFFENREGAEAGLR